MQVYLAAKYPRRDELRGYRKVLDTNGIGVTSRWLDEQEPLDGNMGKREDSWYEETAAVDIEDVGRADAVVFFAEDPTIGIPRGGRHFEMGYGWALGKEIFVVGPKENVFHHLPHVYHFSSFEELVKSLTEINGNQYECSLHCGTESGR
jgi:nucleoside 2-deoxyribosyltransferase